MNPIITIEGFEQLTKQQLFDMAVKHIGSTGVKSTDENGSCIYSGTGCNAAPLLTMNGREIADEVGSWPSLVDRKYVPKHEELFIHKIQEAHDNAASYSNRMEIDATQPKFKTRYVHNMRQLAKDTKLDTTELDKLGW